MVVRMRGFWAALALASLAVTACAPGMQPLLDEYNSLFQVTPAGQEAGQDSGDWLEDLYELSLSGVSYAAHVSLHAPENCSSYKWELREVPGSNSPIPQGFDPAQHGGDTLYFNLDFKAAGFASGGYYELVCTVEKGGKSMQDSCRIKLLD